MKLRGSRKLGKCALAVALALCMSVMMVPATAFAETVENRNATIDHDLDESLGVKADSSGTYTVTAQNVTDSRSYAGYALAVNAEAEGATAVVTTEDVTLGSSNPGSAGVSILASNGGVANATVAGVSAEKAQYGAQVTTYKNSEATLTVGEGGITGKYGLYIMSDKPDNVGTFKVLVNGVVRSTNGDGVYIEGIQESDKVTLVVWKIEQNGQGQLINVAGAGTATLDKYARAVGYIARVSDLGGTSAGSNPTGNLRATYADGTALGTDDIKGTFRVAHEGETIYLAVDDGYEITSAYNGDTPLQKGADGRYSYTVQRGGGIDLLAAVRELAKFAVTFKNDDGTVLQSGEVYEGATPEYTGVTPTKAATDQYSYEFEGWSPAVGPVKAAATYTASYKATTREYLMSFDLGGGTIDGKTTYTVPAAYGSTIALRAPVREGYEFQYWEGSRYYAGDSYKVEGPHSFKAIWKEKESEASSATPVSEPIAETKATPTATAGSSSPAGANAAPATGDSSPAVPALVTLLVSLCALIVSRTKLNQRYVGKHTR